MLNRKKKLALEELRSLLAGWSTGVPARARQFHALRADLDRQVASGLARWWLPGLGEGELAALRQQVDRLGELAPALSTLVRRAEEAEREVLDLRGRAERAGDRELAGWLTDRCVDWQSTLRRLGAQVEREPELEKDQEILGRTEELARSHANALRRLEEAQQLLDRLGSRMETAALRADLPLLRQRLLAEGAGPAWLADVERVVSAVREVADVPPKKPPQTLQQVPELLAEARRWQRVLATGDDSNAALLERSKLADKDWERWTDGEIQALLEEAGEALAGLSRTAAERCAAALARLAERSLQLADACRASPDLETLEQEIGALRTAEAGDPDSYEEWMERWKGVDQHLLFIASYNVGDLQARIDKLQQDFSARLAGLRREPLSGPAASELERLVLELAGLRDFEGDDLEPVFRSLAACQRIAVDLDALAVRVRGERDALGAARQCLLARHRALRGEVERCGIEVLDLEPRIAALAAAESGESLDELRHEAEALELELAALEKELAARCTAWIAERRIALRGVVEALRLLGRDAGEPPEGPAGSGLGFVEGAGAVAGMRRWETALAQQMDAAWHELAARGQRAASELASLPVSALRREERETAIDLRRRLDDAIGSTEAGPEERLRGLFEILESCDTFLVKLSEEERSARERASKLRLRLRDLNEYGLDRFCPPDLVLRASALVHGIPDEPRHWGSVAGQLAAAEDLLQNLEDHARRRAAADLDRGVSALERRLQTALDPAFAGRARGLLSQVEAWGHDRIAPALLRMRVRMLAPEAGGADR
ncbi:MAG TPA: hypothetical protein VGS07_18745 [Thermoanaerobaculia bacterium]|jgi:hypothetical protein|nr:hypothetical protein [Thermoanaerobaculia bacterium]